MAYTAKSIKACEKVKENGEAIIREQWNKVTDVESEMLSDGSKVYNLWIGNVEIACTNQAQAWRIQKQIEDILAKEVVDIQAR